MVSMSSSPEHSSNADLSAIQNLVRWTRVIIHTIQLSYSANTRLREFAIRNNRGLGETTEWVSTYNRKANTGSIVALLL